MKVEAAQIASKNLELTQIKEKLDFFIAENSTKMEVISNLQSQLLKATTERDQFLEQLMHLKELQAEKMDEQSRLHEDLMSLKMAMDMEKEQFKLEKEEFYEQINLLGSQNDD